MSLVELLPAARALDSRDKLRLIREMADDLSRDDVLTLIPAGVELPIWSPVESYEAAAQLEKLLAEGARSP